MRTLAYRSCRSTSGIQSSWIRRARNTESPRRRHRALCLSFPHVTSYLLAVDSKLAGLRAISRIYLKRVRKAGGRAAFKVSLKQMAGRASLIKMLSAIGFRPSSMVRNSEASALRTTEKISQHWRESLHLSSWVRLNLQSDPIRNAGISFCFRSRYRVVLWMRKYSVTSFTVIMSSFSNSTLADFSVLSLFIYEPD
jgi:hypothetical protein